MTITTYPAQFESDVVLRNGRTLRIRPVRPDDREALLALYRGLSPDSLYMRFFDTRNADAALRDAPADVDYSADFGVVGEMVGQPRHACVHLRATEFLVGGDLPGGCLQQRRRSV